MASSNFINKVLSSGIITVDLIDYAPKEKSIFLDLKGFLYQGLIIKEKEFKETLAYFNWEKFRNKAVAIGCSEDTIIPPWVYMMISTKLAEVNCRFEFCNTNELDLRLWKENIEAADFSELKNKKVVVRSRTGMNPSLFISMTEKLNPIVQSLMYGEAGLPKVIWKSRPTTNM